MTPEGQVKDSVKKLLKRYGAQYFMPVSNGMGKAGVSDIICCHRGKYIAIETKAGKGKATPLQLKFMQEVVTAGGAALIVSDDGCSLLTLEEMLK